MPASGRCTTRGGSDRYDAQLRILVARGRRDPRRLFLDLALDGVRRAADLVRPAFDAAAGRDGFVSFEVTPDLADDTAGTVAQGLALWSRLARPNVMIKVPAKDSAYSDVLYVDELVAPGAINTMPEATLYAFADHGDPSGAFEPSSGTAAETLARAGAAGVELDGIIAELERAGVASFCASDQELLDRVGVKAAGAGAGASAR
ncbi:MAG: hypothetical protein HZB46_05815 [Solirubrobacterales bacterium]|nr:hypothetical protein [Solirubrobacterales bacterium]